MRGNKLNLKPITSTRQYPSSLPPGCVWSDALGGWERLYPTAEQIAAERTSFPELSLREAINQAAERMKTRDTSQPEPTGNDFRNNTYIEYDWIDSINERFW
jgi:hypothetical protein